MAYRLWLYKEIVNDTGKKTRLEIEKRNYSGQSYEITALSGDIVLSIDGGSATDPIVKSNLSFSIIDTAQVTYSDFFTPDATLYRVKVYDVNGQTQTVRWTGFVTPDSFGEPLTYRGQINLTARDNLGYLNDLEFDYNNATAESYASIKSIINAAITKIGGMPLVWNVAKKASTAADGTFDNIEDAIVSTYAILGDTWGNVVSELLKGIGCQLRYIDNNTFAVYDIEVLSDSATFAAQQIRFLEQSGYREIQPAWKKGIFNQDYGSLTEFLYKLPSSFSGNIQRQPAGGGRTFLMHSITDEWEVNNNNIQWGLYSPYDPLIGSDNDALYIPYLDINDSVRLNLYTEKGILLRQTDVPVTVSFGVVPVRYGGVYQITHSGQTAWEGLRPAATSYIKASDETNIQFNVIFHSVNGNTYYLRDEWVLESQLEDNDKTMSVGFIYDPRNSSNDVEVSITCVNFPSAGTLAIRIYPPSGKFNLLTNRQYEEFVCDFGLCVKLRDIALKINSADSSDSSGSSTRSGSTRGIKSGRSRQALINDVHNITDTEDYTFGQIPPGSYGITFYKGGFFKNNSEYDSYSHFKRNSSATVTNNLLDLIGRETIQYHKKSWDILSGTVQVTDRTSVMRFGTLTYGGKRYLPISAALNLLANQMSVTSMLEIENYVEEASIVFSDYTGKSSYSGRSGGGSSSSGGGSTSISSHNQLAGRGEDDAHPLSAITGLSDFKDLFDSMFIKKPKTGGGYYIEAQMDFVSILGVTAYGNGSGGGGGSGSAVWGGIVGTLSNQTDLMAALAEKSNVGHTHAYDTISGRPSLALVATSGNYNDLTNKPTIPSLTNYYTKGEIDTALSGKANSSHTHSISDVTGLQTVLDGKQAVGNYAVRASANNLIHSGNEFTFVPSGQSGSVHFNYRTIGGFDGAINNYYFDDGAGHILYSLSTISSNAANGNTAYGWGNHASQGYLTGITKSMVENVLTGNISSHTHSYLPLSGGTLTGNLVLRGLNNATIYRNIEYNTADYARDIITVTQDGVNVVGRFGVYGRANNTLNYIYIGGNDYNGTNLRIGTTDVSFGDNTIYHSGNLTALSQLTDNLGSNPVHTHSQYLTSALAATTYHPKGGSTALPFDAKSLSLAGEISGATTIDASGMITARGYQLTYNSLASTIKQVIDVSKPKLMIQAGATAMTYGNTVICPNGGNLGVGTLSPEEKLDVNGAIVLRNGEYSVKIELDPNGNLKINGNVFATGAVTAYQTN